MIASSPVKSERAEAQSSRAAVSLADVRVDYGDTLAVNDLSLEVQSGQIYGLVGPNGAGKTSTFKVLTTLLQPTYGKVELCGIDVLSEPQRAHGLLGYMPDLAPVPSDLNVTEFLQLFARAHGLVGAAVGSRIEECLEAVELGSKRRAWCRELSRGMMQRLVLAKTLLHRPQVMVLDEPASGMDPRSRAALRRTLRTLAQEGVAVLISSHILSELAEMCSHLGLLREGQLMVSGPVEEVLQEAGESRRILLRAPVEEGHLLARWLDQRAEVTEVGFLGGGKWEIEMIGEEEAQRALLAAIVAEGLPLLGFMQRHQTLEELVLKLDLAGSGMSTTLQNTDHA